MNAIDYARKCVVFEKASPIIGKFNDARYPMVRKPLLTLGDITVNQTVVYKSSSTLGTVTGQIAMAYNIEKMVGDMLFVAQTDDDAEKWSKTRGKKFLRRIKGIEALISSGEYPVTNALWQFIHKFMIVTGPGINSQNSDQVRFLQTDESHLYAPGVLTAFEKRMGARWDRQSFHVTTAPDEGADIDGMFHEGHQDEWHNLCPRCHKLFWPLWSERSMEHYNGEKIFVWRDCQSITMTLESILVVCPWCNRSFRDEDKVRYEMATGGDYVTMNPTAPPNKRSFRWNFAAASWIEYSTILAEHLGAMAAAKKGDLKKHEDFVKKRECWSYRAEVPDFGEAVSGNDYHLGDPWETNEERCIVCSFDVQAGKKGEGRHYWGQVDEFLRNGDSRRIAYERLRTWEQCREFQKDHKAQDKDTYCDFGHAGREVFLRCAEWKWYALGAVDDLEFSHFVTVRKGLPKQVVMRPYSTTQLQDSMTGKTKKQEIMERFGKNRRVPPGFCLSRLWSKPVIGGILFNLKSGIADRYYGIAKDIPETYITQIHSYVPAVETNKKNKTKKVVLSQLKDNDHSFSTSCQCIVGAIIAGFFPMDFQLEKQDVILDADLTL